MRQASLGNLARNFDLTAPVPERTSKAVDGPPNAEITHQGGRQSAPQALDMLRTSGLKYGSLLFIRAHEDVLQLSKSGKRAIGCVGRKTDSSPMSRLPGRSRVAVSYDEALDLHRETDGSSHA